MTRSILMYLGLILNLGVLSMSCPGVCQTVSNPFGWDSPPGTAYPGTIWWWMGSAVTPTELERDIAMRAKAGIRTLRLEAIYAAKGSNLPVIPFLSEEWIQAASQALEIASRHGVTMDFWGNGWPFGGGWIQPEHAARRLEWDDNLSGKVLTEPWTITQDEGNPILAILVIPTGTRNSKARIIEPAETDGKKTWTIPVGEWDVFLFRNGFTRMAVKRAAPGGEGPVLDHFSTEALQDYLKPYTRLLDRLGSQAFGCLHEDSYEVHQANWTGGLLEFFRERRGYDLTPYLPALISTEGSDLSRRVRHDYRQTVEELVIEKHLTPWMEWVRSYGSKVSLQAQGFPGHLVDIFGLADQPDPEAFGIEGMASDGLNRNGGYIYAKFASSAAHLNARRLVSAETFTWLEDHFCTSLDRMRGEFDYFMLAGVNHIYFHSSTYTPSDVSFPGWLYYASIHADPCEPWWHQMPHFSDYIKRVQTPLQEGQPDEDVLLLYPIHTLWFDDRGAINLLQYCRAHNTTDWLHTVCKPAMETAQMLWDHGWKFDWCSDRVISDSLRVENGQIVSGSGCYQALVIPECDWVAEKTPEALRDLVMQGARVICMGKVPQPVPTGEPLTTLERWSQDRCREAIHPGANSSPAGKCTFVNDQAELAKALEEAGARREPMSDLGFFSIRKRMKEGVLHYLKNVTNEPFDGWLPIQGSWSSATLGDPFAGKTSLVAIRAGKDVTEVYLRVPSQGTALLLVERSTNRSPEIPLNLNPKQVTVPIEGPWKLAWKNPDQDGSVLTESLDALTGWTELPALKFFSGTVTYETGFDLDPGLRFSRAILNLGTLHESADVFLNGATAECIWTRPYQIEVTGLLKPGQNRLRIDVTNLLANRIIAWERGGQRLKDRHLFVDIKYKEFDASQWEPLPSGLLGQEGRVELILEE